MPRGTINRRIKENMNKEKKTLAIQAYTFLKARCGVRACTSIIEETTRLGRCQRKIFSFYFSIHVIDLLPVSHYLFLIFRL